MSDRNGDPKSFTSASRRSARLSTTGTATQRNYTSSAPTPLAAGTSDEFCKNGRNMNRGTLLKSENDVSVSPELTERRGVCITPAIINTRKAIRKASSKAKSLPEPSGDSMSFFRTPAIAEERRNWKGWCEVESEPAFFNVMLREFGVEGIKVQEVISLDEEMLAYLPKSVHGLIFLFQFKEDDASKQEAICPDHVWFANQTTSNSCASIALLNIVMNIPDIELGPTLESLKDFSKALTPALRGYSVGNHDFIRQIHNSFARKMDMLNSDLSLANDAAAKKSRKKGSSKWATEDDLDQAGFHFIAFMPIQDSVWKLDGLERQPTNLGKFDGDWMELARPMISNRMRQYEGDEIQFNLLALSAVENQLQFCLPDWRSFIDKEEFDRTLRGPDANYRITEQLQGTATISTRLLCTINEVKSSSGRLLEMHRDLIDAQTKLRAAFIDELAAVEQDNERAKGRRYDYTPLLHTWIRMLADNATLQSLIETSPRR